MCDWALERDSTAGGKPVWTVRKHIGAGVQVTLENDAGGIKRFRLEAAAIAARDGLNGVSRPIAVGQEVSCG